MPVWLTSSRAATFAGVVVLVVGSMVILATGSSFADFGPVIVGAVALGILVALLMTPDGAGSPDQTLDERLVGSRSVQSQPDRRKER